MAKIVMALLKPHYPATYACLASDSLEARGGLLNVDAFGLNFITRG